jgi:hypothetical protein
MPASDNKDYLRDPDKRCHSCGAGPVQYTESPKQYLCLGCGHRCRTRPIWAGG